MAENLYRPKRTPGIYIVIAFTYTEPLKYFLLVYLFFSTMRSTYARIVAYLWIREEHAEDHLNVRIVHIVDRMG